MNTSNSTYDMILRSDVEEKSRTTIEALIYGVFILSAVFSIFQVAVQTAAVANRVASKTVVEHHA